MVLVNIARLPGSKVCGVGCTLQYALTALLHQRVQPLAACRMLFTLICERMPKLEDVCGNLHRENFRAKVVIVTLRGATT